MGKGKAFWRKMCLLGVDLSSVLAAGCIGIFCCYWQGQVLAPAMLLWNLVLLVSFYLAGMLICHMYDTLWRYASTEEFLWSILVTLGLGGGYIILAVLSGTGMPWIYHLVIALFITVEVVSFRMLYRHIRAVRIAQQQKPEKTEMERALIVGAGSAADLLLRDMQSNPHNRHVPICAVDDDCNKVGRFFHGLHVAGTIEEIAQVCTRYQIDEILICIPSATAAQKERIYQQCMQTKRKIYLIPDLTALIRKEQPPVQQLRQINIEDLLNRKSIALDNEKAKQTFLGKVILVTGAGGSIGSELSRQLAKLQPKQLVLLDIYENTVYDLEQELAFTYGEALSFSVEIGSIRDRKKMQQIFCKYRPHIVFHAAAHKHVPLMEQHPEEAVKNNIFGTRHVAEMAIKYGAERFLLISTDKAVNPTNVMGATKRFAEMLMQMFNQKSNTRFVAVRFGNVIGSNGSVIPLFQKQLAKGGPLTVTHKGIIRYFMTIPEAVQLVLEAGSIAKGGEIFILDMGTPVRILDVAEKMIRLAGMEPYQDIDIQIIGLRPGEKLYEELLLSEEGTLSTSHSKIFIATISAQPAQIMQHCLKTLQEAIRNEDEALLVQALQEAVPTYQPQMQYHQQAVKNTQVQEKNIPEKFNAPLVHDNNMPAESVTAASTCQKVLA